MFLDIWFFEAWYQTVLSGPMTLDFAVRKLDNMCDGNLKISIPKSLTIALTRMIHYTCVLLTSTLSSGQIWKFDCSNPQPYGCEGRNGGQGHALTEEQSRLREYSEPKSASVKFDLEGYHEIICNRNMISVMLLKLKILIWWLHWKYLSVCLCGFFLCGFSVSIKLWLISTLMVAIKWIIKWNIF